MLLKNKHQSLIKHHYRCRVDESNRVDLSKGKMVLIGRRVKTSLNSFAGSYGMMYETGGSLRWKRYHLTLNRVIKDRRDLRNVTTLKTEIMPEILNSG